MGRNSVGGAGGSTPAKDSGTDRNRVLIIAASPINRIVISRSIERLYLKATAVGPEGALEALAAVRPMMVIVDEGRQGESLEALYQDLALRRQNTGERLPRVVLIVEPSRQKEATTYGGVVDAVLAKPITLEAIHPVVERLAREGGS